MPWWVSTPHLCLQYYTHMCLVSFFSFPFFLFSVTVNRDYKEDKFLAFWQGQRYVWLLFACFFLFKTATTNIWIVPFSSSLCVCLPLAPGKHPTSLYRVPDLFWGLKVHLIVAFCNFPLVVFWLKEHPELMRKLLFCCQSSFPPFTGSRGGPPLGGSIKKVIFK